MNKLATSLSVALCAGALFGAADEIGMAVARTFTNKTAVITGAASGMGLCTSKTLAVVPRVEEMRGPFPIMSTPELNSLAFDREATLRWFGEHQFGVTPVGRPSDETFGERSVSFFGGKFKIDITTRTTFCALSHRAFSMLRAPRRTHGPGRLQKRPHGTRRTTSGGRQALRRTWATTSMRVGTSSGPTTGRSSWTLPKATDGSMGKKPTSVVARGAGILV